MFQLPMYNIYQIGEMRKPESEPKNIFQLRTSHIRTSDDISSCSVCSPLSRNHDNRFHNPLHVPVNRSASGLTHAQSYPADTHVQAWSYTMCVS